MQYIDTVQYKVGDTDTLGLQLKDATGPINLTGKTVRFNIKAEGSDSHLTMDCTLGSTISGQTINAAAGGATAIITSEATATEGTYISEVEVSDGNGNSLRWPGKDEYVKFIVNESVDH
jgi:hypothetical protein